MILTASYHLTDGSRQAWIEYDDRGENNHWYVFGQVSDELQNTSFHDSADEALGGLLTEWKVDPADLEVRR